MPKYEMRTIRGYDLYEAVSVVQKAIRRGDAKVAGYFAIELLESNFSEFLWDRLLVVSAEDCWGILTQEIKALYDSHKRSWDKKKKTRVFTAKAVILLCQAKKCRDADHLTNFIYDKEMLTPEELEKEIAASEPQEIPRYALDCHTKRGRMMGKTKSDFFKDEFYCQKNQEKGLFDYVIE